jgi:hypothetical protein
MTDFPAIVPSVRAGGMGEYATKKFRHLAGNGTTRIYGKYANNIPLTLEFGGEAGVTDSEAALIYQSWLDARGDRIPVGLSEQLLAGMSSELQARIPSALPFFFTEEAPVFIDTVPGRKRVKLALEGRWAARFVA